MVAHHGRQQHFRIVILFLIVSTATSFAFGINDKGHERRTKFELAISSDHHQQHPPSSQSVVPAAVRLNKVFKATHSRRQADALIQSGRVSVNGHMVSSHQVGVMVVPYVDVVTVDGVVFSGWEEHVLATETTLDTTSAALLNPTTTKGDSSSDSNFALTERNPSPTTTTTTLEYIKYWKPRGVICTTDRRIRDNILDRLEQIDGCNDYQNRIFPVGRLDQDTSGLLLLTSDGRIPQSVLRSKSKVYHVQTNPPFVTDVHVEQLRRGVVITTVAQRDGKRSKPLTAPTLPCDVQRVFGHQQPTLAITLYEGRNRQIRKMLDALGYEVVRLHRTTCLGITMEGLNKPGDWARLTKRELQILLQPAESSPKQ